MAIKSQQGGNSFTDTKPNLQSNLNSNQKSIDSEINKELVHLNNVHEDIKKSNIELK